MKIPPTVLRPFALSTIAFASCILAQSASAEPAGSRVPYDVYAQVNSRLHEDGTHQMANVQDGLEGVRHFAENAPHLRSYEARLAYYRAVKKDRESEFRGRSFRGGWLEWSLKASVKVAEKYAEKRLSGKPASYILGEAGDVIRKGAELGLDLIGTDESVPDATGKYDVPGMAMRSYACALGESDQALRDVCRETVREYQQVDLKAHSLSEQPAVRAAEEQRRQRDDHRAILDSLAKIGFDVGEIGADGKLTAKGMREIKARLETLESSLGERVEKVQQQVELLVKDLSDRKQAAADAAESQRQRNEITGYFGIMGGLAQLTGRPEAAVKFQQAGQLAGAVFDLKKASAIEGAFKDNPAALLNGYMLAAQMAMSLLGGAQEDPQFAAIMGQLKQISEKLEELRVQMNQRFDRVDQGIDYIIADNMVRFEHAQASLDLIRQRSETLQKSLARIESRLEEEYAYVSGRDLNNQHKFCFPTDAKGKLAPLRTYTDMDRCLTDYLLVALGTMPSSAKIGEGKSSATGLDTSLARAAYRDLLGIDAGRTQAADASLKPEDWFYGVKKYLALLSANPKFAADAALNGTKIQPNDAKVNIATLYERGILVGRTMSEMALEQKGGNYFLRKARFIAIADNYRKAALGFLENLRARLKEREINGPDLLQQLSQPAVLDSEAKYPVLGQPFGFCPGVGVQLDQLTVQYGETGIDPQHRRDRLYSAPAPLTLGKNFFDLIPNSLRWAERMGAEGISLKLSPCLSQVRIHEYRQGTPGIAVGGLFARSGTAGNYLKVTYSLELRASYLDGDKPVEGVTVASYTWVREINLPWFEARYNFGPAQAIWTGEGKDGPAIWSTGSGAGIRNSPRDYLASATTNWPVTPDQMVYAEYINRAKVEALLRAKLSRSREKIFDDAKRSEQETELEMAKASWQLIFLAERGNDLATPEARKLLDWLKSGSLPNYAQLLAMVENGKLSTYGAEDLVKDAHGQLRQRIEGLASRNDLRPRDQGFSVILEELRATRDLLAKRKR